MFLDPGSSKHFQRARWGHPRQRGQAIVEFGLVALLFTLLLFGVVDLGILLNGWLGVSSSARDVARQLAVGLCPYTATVTPCVGATPPGGVPSVRAPSALAIQGVDWCANVTTPTAQCPAPLNPTPKTPVAVNIKVCAPADPTTCYTTTQLSSIYPGGTCTSACVHPASNDSIVVTVVAQLQVITPLVRPFFGCTNGALRCDVPIASQAVVRYEGTYL